MDSKKLKTISNELKKASKMHKAQALKIDGMLKSLKTKKWNYGKLSLLR